MSARYLVRFDDLCPTANWEIWAQLEQVFVDYDLCPIIAVVPDNRDSKLMVAEPDPIFWERVRGWQRRGWTIGLHGFQHRYVSASAGIVGVNSYSEFSGLEYEEQEAKLSAGLVVFRRERVRPDLWVAPAHSFDQNTVAALLKLGIDTVSDGFALWPYRDAAGMFWLPQQLWRFYSMPAGVWTVCFHHNAFRAADVARFAAQVRKFRRQIVDTVRIRAEYATRVPNLPDRVYGYFHLQALRLKRNLRASSGNKTAASRSAQT